MSLLDNAGEDEGPIASINIVPFVDVVLVLLVIFMLTSATIARASLEVDLPRAASAGSRVESTINLVLRADGTLLFNGEAVTSWGDVARRIRSAAAKPEIQAVIAADRGVAYGKVIELIDVVKQNGVTTFALDVEQRAGRAP
jgi:biopolymer transport protein ExbD